MAKRRSRKTVATLRHQDASRKNIPTAEYQAVMEDDDRSPIRIAYVRRNRDLDPQLVWRGKDEKGWSDLVVQAPPLFIQEKVHPKVLIDDLMRRSKETEAEKAVGSGFQTDLFADFNGLPSPQAQTEFYQHDANWSNRMILGDSLQVMASLAEREGLRDKVQCIYIDPPYGIKFNSNFQWSTTSRDVKDGNRKHITREPEQVKAFRDTWRDGIHSYLTYMRDRLTVARDLLTESGSVFVQIGDENVHRVRALIDEVFGEENLIAQITFAKTGGYATNFLTGICDYILWYGKERSSTKFRQPYNAKKVGGKGASKYNKVLLPHRRTRTLTSEEKANPSILPVGAKIWRNDNLTSQGNPNFAFSFNGRTFKGTYKTTESGLTRLAKASRIDTAKSSFGFIRFIDDFPVFPATAAWMDIGGIQSRTDPKVYVVQTATEAIKRCILMTTDPGDLVLDPTCGSGTTAYVAEQWGRRWITIDTSRVALALARARIMGARYPYYLLSDSRDGQIKEAALARKAPSEDSTYGDLRQGFVYERVPHIMLRDIANNAEIDVIWEKWQEAIEPLLKRLDEVVSEEWKVDNRKTNHSSLSTHHSLAEWEVPREFPQEWPAAAKPLHEQFWTARVARQREIDASIAAKSDYEYLYDKPYQDNKKVRVAGPFTVDSLSPHRLLGVDENDELIDNIAEAKLGYGEKQDFAEMILEHLKTSGVQQTHKEDKITFTLLTPWPGDLICGEGRYSDQSDRLKGDSPATDHQPLATEKRAGIFIGPEFGTVSRPDLVEAVREAADAGFDVLIACAFNYDAHASELNKLGRVPVLKARMNADLHMAGDLKNTGKGNLFVIFGEPDITVVSEEWLVDSSGNQIAPYEIFKLVSGISRLAEINGLNSKDLRAYAAISCRGEIWDYLADAAGVVVDSGEHRGRTSTSIDGGVSSVARHCAGLPGGTGNLSDLIKKVEHDNLGGFRALVARLRRDKQNALTIHSPLTTGHRSQVTVHGVDVFHPNTGEIRSDSTDGIACWFIDTDYNGESFFVRHAYFLGARDPYKALKTTLKAEINREAWETLRSDTSRPFDKPTSGRIAVKVINHLGDEVMKVFRV